MDAESFKKEFLPYHRKLYCIAYRLLENAADAEDLVQEAYLKLWCGSGLTKIMSFHLSNFSPFAISSIS